jgi:hypothetical protein
MVAWLRWVSLLYLLFGGLRPIVILPMNRRNPLIQAETAVNRNSWEIVRVGFHCGAFLACRVFRFFAHRPLDQR